MKEDAVKPASKPVVARTKAKQSENKLAPSSSGLIGVTAAWAAVGIPLAFGLWNTVQQAVALFK
jgi:hypothetical protein